MYWAALDCTLRSRNPGSRISVRILLFFPPLVLRFLLFSGSPAMFFPFFYYVAGQQIELIQGNGIIKQAAGGRGLYKRCLDLRAKGSDFREKGINERKKRHKTKDASGSCFLYPPTRSPRCFLLSLPLATLHFTSFLDFLFLLLHCTENSPSPVLLCYIYIFFLVFLIRFLNLIFTLHFV